MPLSKLAQISSSVRLKGKQSTVWEERRDQKLSKTERDAVGMGEMRGIPHSSQIASHTPNHEPEDHTDDFL